MNNWYAVYTRSRAEKKVFQELQWKGIDVYLPLYKTIRQWSQRKKIVEVPYIPGYCFVNIRYNDQLNVLQTNNVVAFVKHCGVPAKIPSDQVDQIKRLLKQTQYPIDISFEKFVPGQKVMISAGPLTGLKGEVVSSRGKKKFVIKIEQLNCAFMVQIPAADLSHYSQKKYSLQCV